MSLLTLMILIPLLLTAVVMVAGVAAMAQDVVFYEKHGVQLRVARVGIQAVTLLFLSFAFYLANM